MALYGYQPVSDVESLASWRALDMNKALEEKYKNAAKQGKGGT